MIIAGADKNDDMKTIWTSINPDAVKLSAAINALCGGLINIGYCIIAHWYSNSGDKASDEEEQNDTRYGPEQLTHKTILETVGDKKEAIFT